MNITGGSTLDIEIFYIEQAHGKNCQNNYYFKAHLSPLTDIQESF